MEIHNSIVELHNWIMEIHNYEVLSPLALQLFVAGGDNRHSTTPPVTARQFKTCQAFSMLFSQIVLGSNRMSFGEISLDTQHFCTHSPLTSLGTLPSAPGAGAVLTPASKIRFNCPDKSNFTTSYSADFHDFADDNWNVSSAVGHVSLRCCQLCISVKKFNPKRRMRSMFWQHTKAWYMVIIKSFNKCGISI